MCGRYRLSRRKQIIEEHFDTSDWQDDWSPRYNIAPTQAVPVTLVGFDRSAASALNAARRFKRFSV